MQLPQTPERIKEVPAQALRAVFAGVGQVLLLTERVRRRTVGHIHFPPFSAPAATTAPPAATAPATAEPPATLQPPTTPEPAAPEPAAAAPEPAPVAAEPVAAAPAVADLPLEGYPRLTFASLRARMRGLDAGQLRVLIAYEQAHEGRANVITMFERRIAKLEGAEDADDAAS